jgi:hypothetical protein
MFVLRYACVHYGARSYPMNNLPSCFQRIAGPDDIRPEDLTSYVGRAYGFPREFTIRHDERRVIDLGSGPLEVPEVVVATANGFSFIWHREVAA